jgi:hypothetical protein
MRDRKKQWRLWGRRGATLLTLLVTSGRATHAWAQSGDSGPQAEPAESVPKAESPPTAAPSPSPSAQTEPASVETSVPSVPSEEPKEPPPRWYGWQALITDGAALGAFAFVPVFGNRLIASVPIFFLGTPIVHLANGRPLVSLLSVAMRAGVPIGMAQLGSVFRGGGGGATDFSCKRLSSCNEQALGLGLGAAAVVVVDAALLAYERPTPAVPKRASVLPTGFAQPGALSLGVTGSF